tara:strand:- start:437 stop:1381 length:945 start_codon:yes stop_codon:yes gene_type:complete
MHVRTLGLSIALLASSTLAQQPSFTKGPATQIDAGLFDCGGRGRISAVGSIRSDDGKTWTVPAATRFRTATKAADLYNACAGKTPASLADVDLKTIPVLDAGGREAFVAYVFADNYFELYVNGKLLAVDAVPFTPFNSSVIRFTARRPVTIAVKLVDWEENLGLGSERGRGHAYQPGDGGLVMHIQDAAGKTVALTDGSWRAQTFYTGPLKDRACLKVAGQIRDSTTCDVAGSSDGRPYSGAHWSIPADWAAPGFDDSIWPRATTYANATVGVDNKPAYTHFTDVFDMPGADAQFIWSSNLVLDNLVLVRKTFE